MTDLPYKSSNNCILSLEIFAFRVQPTKHDACLRVSFKHFHTGLSVSPSPEEKASSPVSCENNWNIKEQSGLLNFAQQMRERDMKAQHFCPLVLCSVSLRHFVNSCGAPLYKL